MNKPNFAIALREERPQVAKFNASAGAPGELGPGALDSSGEVGGTVGKNMALNYGKEDQVYLPQPDLGQVALVDTTNLREVRGFDVGGDPEWVAVHPGSQTLFALSKDGSTVTTLDLEDPKKTFDSKINAGEGARIETPERGLEPEFWMWDPNGISHYAGLPPELKVSMLINAAAFATDIEAAQRAYVGKGTSNRVVAVEGDP